MKSNCYHWLNSKDQKTAGGLTHCSSYEEAAAHATSGFSIKSTPTGRLYFANAQGEEVRVYLSVHPEHTPEGAILQEQIDKKRQEQLDQALTRFM